MKGNSWKYLKYAIGEIILVMIGILLALQVNNWNQDRQRRKLEKNLLVQLREDLDNMAKDIKSDLVFLENAEESHFIIKELIEKDATYIDSLCFDFNWLILDEYVYPIRPNFEKLKAEGLDIVSNFEVRDKILKVFEVILPRISKENSFFPDISQYFDAYYKKHFSPNSDYSLIYSKKIGIVQFDFPKTETINNKEYLSTIGFVPNNFESLKKDNEFKVIMQNAQRFRSYKINRYNQANFFVVDLIKDIDKYLKTL